MQLVSARLSARTIDALRLLTADGWEATGAHDGALMMDDGRPISWLAGIPYTIGAAVWETRVKDALAVAEHARRLDNEMEKAIQRDAAIAAQDVPAQPQAHSEICPAIIDGQLCGGSLSATPVCPRCALGKQGVAQILTCDVCGAQTAVMK